MRRQISGVCGMSDGAASPNGRARLIAVVALFAAAWTAAFLGVAEIVQDRLIAEQKVHAAGLAASYGGSLSQALHRRMALVRGLAAYVTAGINAIDGDSTTLFSHQFHIFAEELSKAAPGFRNVSVSPGMIVRFIHPFAGNEKVLGNDLLKDPRPGFVETVQRAIATRNVTIHGPLTLIQGGRGMIARQAIFKNDQVWGVVGLIFDPDAAIAEAGFVTLPRPYRLGVRNEAGQMVTGNAAVFDGDPVTARVSLPEGEWQLAILPEHGWLASARAGFPYAAFLVGFMLVGGLLLVVIVMTVERRSKLEALVAQRTAELERKNAELQRFADIAAHDLQEPLRRIISFAQLLARRYNIPDDAETTEYTHFLTDNAARMKSLLRDIQLYVALDRLDPPMGMLDPAQPLQLAIDKLKGQIESTGTEISIGPLPEIYADSRSLVEIFTALIANAVEYRAPDRAPKIEISAESDGKKAVFTVADNGIGIESLYFSKIFEIFQRLHNSDEHPGTGIGLAIARKLAERLGGEIWVASEVGRGSRFSFSVPLRQAGA